MNNPALHQGIESHTVEAGLLNVTSGKLIASDPLVFFDEKPFARAVQPGEYPVILKVVKDDRGYDRIASAMLRITEQDPVRWEIAAREWSGSRQGGGEIEPYSVDSGTGCFMDASFQETFYEIVFGEESNGNYDFPNNLSWNGPQSAQHFRCENGHLIMFSSGLGDGGYKTFVGLDVDGHPTAFVTDFEILNYSLYEN